MVLCPPHQKGGWAAVTTFYLASETEQFALIICLFCSLILCMFYMFASLDRGERKQNRLFNTGVLIALLLLLCMTADTFNKKVSEVPIKPLLSLPMWVLWCIVGASSALLLYRTASLILPKGRTLSHMQSIHCPVRSAILPQRAKSSCAICKCTVCSGFWRKVICSILMNCRKRLSCLTREAAF